MDQMLLVIGGVVVSLASNAAFGRRIGAISDQRALGITPRRGAFSIWGLIYPLLVVSAVSMRSRPAPPGVAAALGASLALSAAWVPLFAANTPPSLVGAALALCGALGAAVAAVAFAGGPSLEAPAKIAVQAPAALYAGWLCCAAVLSIGIALKAYALALPDWSLLALALGVTLLTVATRNPVLALPALWAIAWQTQPTVLGGAGAAALVGGTLLATIVR